MKKLSVIIINYNTAAMTERTIRRFLSMETSLKPRIILIDNGSHDRVSDKTASELGLDYIKNGINRGFGPAVNQGLRLSRSEYVLLLNSDMLIEKNAVSRLLKFMEREKQIAVAGPQFIYPQGGLQPSFGNFPTLKRELWRWLFLYHIMPGATIVKDAWFKKVNIKKSSPVDWVSGGFMLIRQSAIEEIGEFDENYFLGVEDIDFCYRVKKAGWLIAYFPLARAVHFHGFSSGGLRNILRFKHDRDGFIYFFMKHFPKKKFSRKFISWLYDLKILSLRVEKYARRKFFDSCQPKDATIAVTYRCNSRCRMCNIWRDRKTSDLPASALSRLSPAVRYVNLTGGEPFLRNDLPALVRLVKTASPRAKIIISSNGLATGRIVKAMAKILEIDPRTGVRISLDGIGAAHDRIRGVAGIYKRAITTIEKLRILGVKNLGVSFTIMDANIHELKTVYSLAKTLNLELALALVQNSSIYFKKGDNRITALDNVKAALDYVIARELKSFSLKRWLRAYYDYGLKYYALYHKRLLPSGAGRDSLFIDPAGTVFPSNLINVPMGNLNETGLDAVWTSRQAENAREKITRGNIEESWIICTIRGELKRHGWQVGAWIITNKFLLWRISAAHAIKAWRLKNLIDRENARQPAPTGSD